MKNFRTLDQAKKDMQIISEYVTLIENYRPTSIKQQIIYHYALLGSIQKTTLHMNEHCYQNKDCDFLPQDVKSFILSPPGEDQLHKIIRSFYLKRTKPSREKIKRTELRESYWKN